MRREGEMENRCEIAGVAMGQQKDGLSLSLS